MSRGTTERLFAFKRSLRVGGGAALVSRLQPPAGLSCVPVVGLFGLLLYPALVLVPGGLYMDMTSRCYSR
jgi:hypothetical protein